MTGCVLCAGGCAGVELTALTAPELRWLWDAIATAADRRGDEHMTGGPTVTVTAPGDPAHRAAAAGLLSARLRSAGQRTKVDLVALTATLAPLGPALTPGAVAAHATGRRLAGKARERQERDAATVDVYERLRVGLGNASPHLRLNPETVLERLARTGWIARIRNYPTPAQLITSALAVMDRLPEVGTRADRRTLVPSDPHALDSGVLASLVLAIMGMSGTQPRLAWSELGVDIDDLLGGLIVTGVTPRGWSAPDCATLTIPPKELSAVTWTSPPRAGDWVFVTENPSVLSAAVETFRDSGATARVPRVVCTVGTPSRAECAAVGALVAARWQVAVRADFDGKGLEHVRALRSAEARVVPWRMGAADYMAAATASRAIRSASTTLIVHADATPWDSTLAAAINEAGVPVFEEDLLPHLLADIARGHP